MSDEQDNEDQRVEVVGNILDLPGPTAFYLANGGHQVAAAGSDVPYEELYTAVVKVVLKYLKDQSAPRAVVSAIFAVAFDIVTTTMAMTNYDDESQQGLTQEKDIEGFIKTFLMMANVMPQAIEANGALLVHRKSIFSEEARKLDS